jgi:hypothetical protein
MSLDVSVIAIFGSVLGAALSFVTTLFSRKAASRREEAVREQIRELASQYSQIRSEMPSGHDRTLRLELIADQMRALGSISEPSLQELMISGSPGERLAAAVALQVQPRAKYLHWLAERLKSEKPFIGYHAALALLSAVRKLEEQDRGRLRSAIEEARAALGADLVGSDRWAVLEEAARQTGLTPARASAS